MPINEAAVDAALQAALARGMPRVVVAAASSDGVLFERALGERVYTKQGADSSSWPRLDGSNEVSMDSVFWLASCTKLITSIAATQLIERGQLTLDDPVEKFVPDIAALKILKSYDGEPVFEEPTTKPTARMLFTHTAGFCYDWESPAIAKYRVEKKLGNLLWDTENNVPRHAITGVPLHFNPGDRFVYGTSSDWLGFVVEAISGMDLDAYFRENIFKPLNIHDSSFYELPGYEAKHTNVVRHTGTYTSDNERVDDYKPDQPWLTPRPQTCLGGAGLRGSPRSYLRVLQALLRKGELDGARILKPESVELFFSPHIERDDVLDDLAKFLRYNNDPYSRAKESGWVEGESSVDSLKNWGLGGALYLEALESGRSSGSMAWSGVAQTHWVVDPKSDVCFIVWSNTLSTPCWDPNLYTMWRKFEKELYKGLDNVGT